MKTIDVLLDILKNGAVQCDDVFKKLVKSQALGFGVEPEDVVSAALISGKISTFSDGGKSWARIAPPFVALERGNDWGVNFLAYKAKDERGNDWIKNAVVAHDGQTLDVKWPDGTITICEIVLHVKDNGGGRPWDQLATESIPGVMIMFHGVSAWVPLDTPGLKVRADAL